MAAAMSDDDFLPREPNDAAYVTRELRTGPPLDYVAEKTRLTLEALHEAIRQSDRESQSWSHVRYAFVNALKSHLALKNMLALMNDAGLDDRLLAMRRRHFAEWLDRIDREGSTTG